METESEFSVFSRLCREQVEETLNEINMWNSITDALRWKKYFLAKIKDASEIIFHEMAEAREKA